MKQTCHFQLNSHKTVYPHAPEYHLVAPIVWTPLQTALKLVAQEKIVYCTEAGVLKKLSLARLAELSLRFYLASAGYRGLGVYDGQVYTTG